MTVAPAKPLDSLPYRLCVGIALFSHTGFVWIGSRSDVQAEGEGSGSWWQMPQGGLDKGEDPFKAAKRELYEETSVTSVSLIKEAPEWFAYDLPAELVPISWGGRYRGQKQKWIAMRFLGGDSDIDIRTEHPEFAAWKWLAMEALPRLIVPFKRDTYEKVIAEFRDLAFPVG